MMRLAVTKMRCLPPRQHNFCTLINEIDEAQRAEMSASRCAASAEMYLGAMQECDPYLLGRFC